MHQWPIVAVAAAVKVDGGTITEARVGLTNMGSTPLRAPGGGGGAGGTAGHGGRRTFRSCAGRRGRQPAVDLNGDADYRRHLATVPTRRAVLAAAGA